MNVKRIILAASCLLFQGACFAQHAEDTISLAGTWRFEMDSADRGVQQKFYSRALPETIHLPGSMEQNNKGYPLTLYTRWTASIYDSSWYFNPRMARYRQPGNLKFPFFLTPLKRYVGPAWYQKTIMIPARWENKHITLFIERAHWETRVWVDGNERGMQNSLSAPQVYDLTGLLSPGKHTITIRVDNRIKAINPGPDSHSITDQTQGNWNGIVGKIQLLETPKCRIAQIQTYPDIAHKSVKVKLFIHNGTGHIAQGKIIMAAKSFNTPAPQPVESLARNFTCEGTDTIVEINYPMGKRILTWDEFHPALYRLKATLSCGNGEDTKQTEFGMREFSIRGTRFTINGRPVFLRGTVENCDFPLTGYAPMDVDAWMRVFKIAKSYGLNEMRFHSYCPPEAAFMAADREGFYLHVEGPSWANHGSSLGDGKPIDQYIYDETDRIDEAYGNHPSFCMMAYGNEPRGGHQAEYLDKFVDYWKAKDPRHLYTGASVGMSWPWVKEEQFIVRSGPRGLPWVNERPGTMFDHRKALEGHNIPYIAHEMGQYCAFPDFKEIKEYTGVHKAKNFELFREDLQDHDMGDEAEEFLKSSGKLQVLCYKGEVEAALRTPGFAGFELLSLNDYSGQGTALVGVLNVFWQSKGYTTPAEFRRFCAPVVPLARIPKFTYYNDETFNADIEIANFSEDTIRGASPAWQITDQKGNIMGSGRFSPSVIPVGNNIILGKVKLPLQSFSRAARLTLQVSLRHGSIANSWNFWVYPKRMTLPENTGIYFCHELDDQAKNILNKGGKVLLLCAGKVEKGKDISMHFLPVFWNTSWFKMRPPHTTGIYLDPKSPAFKYFPTADFSDFQWWGIVNKQQVMWLEDFPPDFRPLVQPIDTWFLNRRLGLIFEAKTGSGKLMVCSADLDTDPDDRPAARQLLYSLTKYMGSKDFNPKYSVPLATIQGLFEKQQEQGYNTYSQNNFNGNALQADLSWVKKAGAKEMPQGKAIFKVNDYGAVNDGRTMDTRFIQKAIDDCAAKGGGIITFEPGEYITGSVFLKSGVTLRIDKAVKISGSQDINDYPLINTRVAGIEMKWPAALINVLGQQNVAITGEGIVDGRGKPFWDSYWTLRKVYDPKGIRWAADYDCHRPRLLLISRSSDVTLKGIHLQRSGFWTVHILYSNHITVEGITVQNNIGGHGPSTDGIDIDSSAYILVEHCDIDCNDDDYCLKAGRDADGLRVNRPTECVVIRNCIARKGGGLATFGSETSGGIRHVLVENSLATGTANGVNFKSAFTRGGTVEDIHIRNLKMENVNTAINLNVNWNPSYSYTTLPPGYNYDSIPGYWKVMLQKSPPSKGTPTIQNVYIHNIEGTDCKTAIHAIGMKTSPLKNFELTNINITANTAGKIEYAKNWHFDQVAIQAKDSSRVEIQDAVNVNPGLN